MSRILAVVGSSGDVARVRAAGVATLRCATPADAPDDVPVLAFGGAADQPHVTYVVRPGIADAHLMALVQSLVEQLPRPPAPRPHATDQQGARRMQAALTSSRRLAATSDLAGTESTAIDAVAELVDADRVWFLYHDSDDGALWSEAKLKADRDDRKATAGLAGFAARTGLGAAVERASDDPRWDRSIDDPSGDGESRLLVEPIRDSEGVVQAVIVAARDGRRAPFGDAGREMLAAFAGFASPFLDQLSIHMQAQQILEEDQGAESIFRKEALDAQVAPRWGDVVRVSPAWMSWTYWLLVIMLIGAGAYLWIGRVATYSSGLAVIRSTSRSDVAARNPGNVTAVDLAPGDTVAAGEVIAHLDDAQQRAAVDRLTHEFETQLRNHLLSLDDPSAEAAVRSVHLDLETAKTELEDRLIRSPGAGVVTDVRVRPGQHLEPGDIVASLADGNADLEIVALLPGADRPQLKVGMPLRLELQGYQYAYQELLIDSVSQDVISPNEAKHVLGPDFADLPVGGPVVLVRGHLPSSEFTIDGHTYRYHDGMEGTAEVPIREERLLYTLVPGMRRFE